MRIQNGTLLTMEGKNFACGYVDIEGGKIKAFGDMAEAPPYKGKIFNAEGGYIMPGLIDAHTHIGIGEEGLRWEGEDYNESTNPATPAMRAIDGFNPFEPSMPKALAGGVTAAGISPGSANVIGGTITALKLAGDDVEKMIIKEPAAMKMAMGENPKSVYGRDGKAPKTRMGTAAIMRENLTKAQKYIEKKAAGEENYDAGMEALIPVLKREIPVHIHAHRADDIMTALRIVKEFNLRCVLIHATDSAKIADHIKKSGVIPVVGPSEGPAGKPETMSVGFDTAGKLHAAGVETAITTDHGVQPLWLLPMYAAMCVREGLPEDAALRAITIIPAKALGIENRTGSIKAGKDADIAVFTGHPFHYLSRVKAVFVDGKQVVK